MSISLVHHSCSVALLDPMWSIAIGGLRLNRARANADVSLKRWPQWRMLVLKHEVGHEQKVSKGGLRNGSPKFCGICKKVLASALKF